MYSTISLFFFDMLCLCEVIAPVIYVFLITVGCDGGLSEVFAPQDVCLRSA